MRYFRQCTAFKWTVILQGLVLVGTAILIPNAILSPSKAQSPSSRETSQKFVETLPTYAMRTLGSAGLRHGYSLNGIAFCPSTDSMVTADGIGGVHLWDARTGHWMRDFHPALDTKGPTPYAQEVFYLPATDRVCATFSIYPKSVLVFWARETGKLLAQVDAHEAAPCAVAASTNGKVVVSADTDGCIKVWDPASFKPIKQHKEALPKGELLRLSLSADGAKMLCSVKAKGRKPLTYLVLWDVNNGNALWKQEEPTDLAGSLLSPDAKFAICRSMPRAKTGSQFSAWDAVAGKKLTTIAALEKGGGGPFTFAEDGKSLFVIQAPFIKHFEVPSGKELATLPGGSGAASKIALHSAAKTLAFSEGQRVRIFDLANAKEIIVATGHSTKVNRLSFARAGIKLLSGNDYIDLRVWQISDGKELARLPVPLAPTPIKMFNEDRAPAAISPEGDLVAFGRKDGIVEIANINTGKWDRQLKPGSPEVDFVRFSSDGKHLVTAQVDGFVNVLAMENAATKAKHFLNRVSPDFGCSYDLTADDRFLAYHHRTEKQENQGAAIKLGNSGFLGVYDLTASAHVWRIEVRGPQKNCRLSLSQDGKLVAAVVIEDGERGLDYSVGLWEVKTGKSWGTIATEPRAKDNEEIRSICLCDKANVLAIGLANGHIELWDLKTSKHLLDLTGHKGPVEALALSPDGHTLASGGSEGTIVLWDLRAATAQKRKGKGFSLLP